MANSFNSLVANVNEKISEMNTEIGKTNGAATQAREAANTATEETAKAVAATTAATEAADRANDEAEAWENAVINTETLDAGSNAEVSVEEKAGVKNITFKIPRGATGAAGAKGDTGKSGVTFTISGTKLYIKTT